jgi:hypothetical protein
VAALVMLVSCSSSGGSDDRVSPLSEWVAMAPSPLAGRANHLMAWTGTEVVVAGGLGHDDFCRVEQPCVRRPREFFDDPAAYSPSTDTWRQLSAAPEPFTAGTSAVVGDVIYVLPSELGSGAPNDQIWAYGIGEDSWDVIPGPDAGDQLVTVGNALVAVPFNDEFGTLPLELFDATVGGWSTLPPDPIGPSAARTAVWNGDALILFSIPLPADRVFDEGDPHLAVARFEPTTWTWSRVAGPPAWIMANAAGWTVDGPMAVQASVSCAAEDEPCLASAVTLDLRTEQWSRFPAAPATMHLRRQGRASVIGRAVASYLIPDAPAVDLAQGRWIDIPRLPSKPIERPGIVAAGLDTVVFGGLRPVGGLHLDGASPMDGVAEGWLLQSGATPVPIVDSVDVAAQARRFAAGD